MEKQLVPTLRFPEFNDEWKEEKFDDILSITRLAGYEYSKYWEEDLNKEIIALRGYNIGKGKLDLRDLSYISNKLSQQLNRSKLYKNDIIYPCVGSIGNAVVIEEDNKYHIQQNIAKITCNVTTDPYYITHFLMSHLGMKEVVRFNATSSQPNVLVGSLRQFKINLPTLPEQQKIASFLTEVDTRIQTLEKKKSLVESYKKGVMQKLFSQELRFKDDNGNVFPEWETKRLNDILELLTDFEANGSFASVKDNVTVLDKPDFAWYVRATDLENNTNLENVKYVDEHSYKFLRKTPLKGKELLITKRGEIGKVYFYEPNKEIKATLAPNMYLLKLNSSVIPKFVYYYFINSDGNKKLKRINASTTIGALYKDDVKSIKMKIPSSIEQIKIADFLSAIDAKIEVLQSQIDSTNQFKKGLLQQMFV